jgi:hypothetical protein
VGLGLVLLIVPMLQGLLLARNSTIPLVRYFIAAVPLTFAVGLIGLGPLLAQRTEHGRYLRGAFAMLGALALLFAASNVSGAVVLATSRYQDLEHDAWVALTQGTDLSNAPGQDEVADAMRVGRTLTQIIPPGSRVLLDEYGSGFAIVLGARSASLFVDHTHPRFEEALNNPPAVVDYVLVPSKERRGGLNAVNQRQPRLYEEGAPWAELLDRLPPSYGGWRLYRVQRQTSPGNPASGGR